MKQLIEMERAHRQILSWKLGFQTIRKIQTPIMLEMISPRRGEHILDAGCGSGSLSFEMGKDLIIVALDISSGNVKDVKIKFNYLGHKGFFIVGSVTHLPLRSHIFDKVLLSSVLQHIQNPKIVLEEIHRVLRTAGVFVVNVPSDRPYLYLPSLLREKYSYVEKKLLWNIFKAYHKWSTENMKKMLKETGFKVVSLEYSPKYVAAFIYEINLLFTILEAPKKIVSHLLFVATPVMYLLSKLDYVLPKKMRGSEFIMKAEKVSFV